MVCFWCLEIRLGSLRHHCGLVTNRTCPLNRWSSGIIHAEFACGVITPGLAVLSRASDVKQAANSGNVASRTRKLGYRDQLARVFAAMTIPPLNKLVPNSRDTCDGVGESRARRTHGSFVIGHDL